MQIWCLFELRQSEIIHVTKDESGPNDCVSFASRANAKLIDVT